MKSKLFGALRDAGSPPQSSDVQLIDGRFRYTVMHDEIEALKREAAHETGIPRRRVARKP